MMSPRGGAIVMGNTTSLEFYKGPGPVCTKKVHYNQNGTGRDTYIM